MIGNYLMLYNKIERITEIGYKDGYYYLRVEGKNNGYYIDEFAPINIDLDIFNKLDINSIINTVSVKKNTSGNWFASISSLDRNICYSLHELQNLYFLIEGEQLKLK